MDTNVFVENNNVVLEIKDLTDTIVQIVSDQEGNSETYVKLKIPIKTWKRIVSNVRRNRTSPNDKQKLNFTLDL